MGTQTDGDTAAARLAQLHFFFREHPIKGPEGHSFTSSAPRATATSPALPFNAAVVDHVRASVQEIVDATRAINPDAAPFPPRVEAAYEWCRANTTHATVGQAQRIAVLEYRHRLEHAIRAGDTKVIRPHRCPACGTFSLFWRAAVQRAICVNHHCADENNGISRSWRLSRLAYEHVIALTALRHAT